MSDLQQAIDKLRSSPHFKELAAYKPPFNPFEIAGVTHRELTHSSVLAWLLRDEANKEFRQRFVTWIRDRMVAESEKKEDHRKLQKLWEGLDVPESPEDSSLKPKIVRTEKGDKINRIDVFAHFESLKLVIGIEVKVWAGEQDEQVKRYQKLLCQNHPGYKKAVVFLTPTGWKQETADENNVHVPVLAMSWGCVSDMIREMRSALGDENDFRMQFSQHLERNIAMSEKEEKRIVRKLLSEGDNAETLDKIIENMPSLLDYSAQWKKIVAEVCDVGKDSLKEVTYSHRGIVKELKIWIPEWHKAGLPFTVMLYKYQNAGVRILLFQGDFHEEAKAKLEEFAEFANRSGRVVNDKFPQLIGWSAWRSVLKDDGTDQEIKGTLIDNIWSEDWAEKVEKQLREQIEDSGLLRHINEWIETKGANRG